MSFESMAPHEGNLETFSLATRRVIRFSVGFLVIVLLTTALVLAGASAIQSGAADPNSPGTQAGLTLGLTTLGLLTMVCLVGLVISTVVWIVSAHKVSPSGPGAVGYGGLFATLLLISLSYIVPMTILVADILRISGWAALIAGVVLTRGRIRRETGRPDLGGRRRSLLQSDDWDASKWDPEVHRDIERRGRPGE
ncbi:hypothetical protein Aph02nite_35340 [Actinoplanes philippinensis]|uniref:Tryptophan-associated transmembrane protein (Trp_oprn_chp) n=1 Tax=Actinoplanes philippinensis TaxID=35752 RepID=A0A1I2F995_9ACTN|nr:hypothetical protein [Actinoplanes philippinensis]GIE77584.1 hypothetical protein Aph02nite_35340 [Actinoplanes philippinensis]SFF01922.1 hypothetical protein SAMN05421541_105225 [Actinoplanes philippinensis]